MTSTRRESTPDHGAGSVPLLTSTAERAEDGTVVEREEEAKVVERKEAIDASTTTRLADEYPASASLARISLFPTLSICRPLLLISFSVEILLISACGVDLKCMCIKFWWKMDS